MLKKKHVLNYVEGLELGAYTFDDEDGKETIYIGVRKGNEIIANGTFYTEKDADFFVDFLCSLVGAEKYISEDDK